MRKIRSLPEKSSYIGDLPEGCTYCGPGEKMVLLITGKCQRICFYCPLSYAKRGKDVIYANELKVEKLTEIIQEARNISAKGTGITGGDPMLVPDKTMEAIRLLKSSFGSEHHIHLYSAGDFQPKYIDRLKSAGLDELRFHPPLGTWRRPDKSFIELLRTAVESELSVGAELPLLPEYESDILQFAHFLVENDVEFLNLNELEFSETNWKQCKAHGYVQSGEISSTVQGSETLGYKILHTLANEQELKLNVHYCSAQYKDRQQLRNRLKRRAANVIAPHQLQTDDVTFLLGIIEPSQRGDLEELKAIYTMFNKKYKVPDELLKLDVDANRLEVAAWVLKELKQSLPTDIRIRSFIIEEYPTADRLEVERIPLDEF